MREVDDGNCSDHRDVFTCQGGLTRRRVPRGLLRQEGPSAGLGSASSLSSRRAGQVPEAVVVALLRANRWHPHGGCAEPGMRVDSSKREPAATFP